MRVRTGYSFRTASGHIEEVATRLVELGWKTAPITDRLATFGHVRWRDLVTKKGLRPIYGVELAVTNDLGAKQPGLDYWTFIAQTSVRPLHDLIWKATANPGAALSYAEAIAATGVTKIVGGTARLDLIDPGLPDLYMALAPGIPNGLLRRADAFRKVASSNNFYPRIADRELYRVIMGRFASVQTWPQHIVSDDELAAIYGDERTADAVATRDRLMAESVATLPTARMLVPAKPASLRAMCEAGAEGRRVNLADPVYRDRLTRELDMIALKKFEDYFYIIADMVEWAKRYMVVGPARGSSCGSLVCYLLGITAIDPIRYELLFERFIDITRPDLPDIDLDFSDRRRDLVFEYVEQKYGRDHVARLGSVSTYKAKSVLHQVGISLKVPSWKIDELSNTVIKRSMGDSRAGSTIGDTFVDTEIGRSMIVDFPELAIASRMESHPNNAGQHAAGIVITETPVAEIVAMDARTGGTMCDKKDAEKLGLLKIDALGLTQLGIFERCLELIGVEPRSEWLEAIPIDDQAAFDVLNRCAFSGIFQFVPGSSSAGLVREMIEVHGGRIDTMEDIISLTALVRPGPLGSGAHREWVLRRTGHNPVAYFHPAIEPYVRSTLGIVTYQEQVMQIAREVGGLSWDDVTALRKAMSRSLGKEFFDVYGDRWKNGDAARGLPQETRHRLWDDLCSYGMWAFNRSHSVAYALVSYWACWLKAHHPLEFAAAMLDSEGDLFKQITMLRELRDEGISYVAIDPDLSTDRWQPVEKAGRRYLVGPLTAIRGIGPAKMRQILDARRTGAALPPSITKSLANARTEIDSLSPIADTIARLHPDLRAAGIVTTPISISDAKPGRWSGPVVIVGVVKRINPLNENEPARIARRDGRVYSGPLEALNMTIRDDSGEEIFCKVGRFQFAAIGRAMLEKARAGKSIYAIKGTIPEGFAMITVSAVRYLGELDDATTPDEAATAIG